MTTNRPSSPAELAKRERTRVEQPQRAAAAGSPAARRPTAEEWREVVERGSRLRLGAQRPVR